jgi:hypothetical protein
VHIYFTRAESAPCQKATMHIQKIIHICLGSMAQHSKQVFSKEQNDNAPECMYSKAALLLANTSFWVWDLENTV